MLNAGIIGCGNIAWKWSDPKDGRCNTHAKAYHRHPRVRLMACCDIAVNNARALARSYPGTAVYADYRTMLQREPLDMVSVCTPTATHYEVIDYILRATGIKHIVAEKPLTADRKETARIYAMAKRKGSNIIVNYLRRYDPSLRTVRELVHGGSMGRCDLGIVITYGPLKRNAVHFIDFFDYMGMPLTFKRAIAPSALLFATPKGKPVMMYLVDEKKHPCNEMDLFFEKGRIKIGEYSDAQIYRPRGSKTYGNFRELVTSRRLPSTIDRAMRYVIDDAVHRALGHTVDFTFLQREMRLADMISNAESALEKVASQDEHEK